jgi:hypothetical protein
MHKITHILHLLIPAASAEGSWNLKTDMRFATTKAVMPKVDPTLLS